MGLRAASLKSFQVALSPEPLALRSPTPSSNSASPSLSTSPLSPIKDIVRKLLDELVTSVALQHAEEMISAGTAASPPISCDDAVAGGSTPAAAAAVRRSAITALREGIDARCDEPASIEAMELALDGGGCDSEDSLLFTTPFKQQRQPLGTTLQVRRGDEEP